MESLFRGLPRGKRLCYGSKLSINTYVSAVYNYVFELFDGEPDFDPEDAGRLATSASRAVEVALVRMLAVDDEIR